MDGCAAAAGDAQLQVGDVSHSCPGGCRASMLAVLVSWALARIQDVNMLASYSPGAQHACPEAFMLLHKA
jgi:hypothetical protein